MKIIFFILDFISFYSKIANNSCLSNLKILKLDLK